MFVLSRLLSLELSNLEIELFPSLITTFKWHLDGRHVEL